VAPDSGHHRWGPRQVRRFARVHSCCAALIAFGLGAIARRGVAGQVPPHKLWHTRSRRQCWGARLRHPTLSTTRCLTARSSRIYFATWL